MSDIYVSTIFETGVAVIRDELSRLRDVAGVYRMLGADGSVLYVGKAKSLKKRVVNYTRVQQLPRRLQRMVAETRRMEFIVTQTEVEALLLEASLIKNLKPQYNILLRDDKTYPYILMTGDHDYPQIMKFRGRPDRKGDYFGPFASGQAVSETLVLLQRVFMLRNCTDNVFSNRSRPCLQYHIKRCTAPCVGLISNAAYQEQVSDARDFLSGKSRQVQDKLQHHMLEASKAQNYEQAGAIRDRIRVLTQMQAKQRLNGMVLGDSDIVALARREGRVCIQIFFFRGGQSFGNRSFYPVHAEDSAEDDIMVQFLAQFYQGKPVPAEILVNVIPADLDILEEGLSLSANRKVSVTRPQRGPKKEFLDFVTRNADEALQRHILERQADSLFLEEVAQLFDMDKTPDRIEIYDNSHISGTNMIGAMVVAGPEGLMKKAYRKFNIKSAQSADDYGMMREVMTRRFANVELGVGENWPNLLLIDGGLGQLNAVHEVLDEMGVSNYLTIVGIAKGEDRNAGREKFFMRGKEMFQLPLGNPVLHYLQRLRDEAHRFAIGTHRSKRAMATGKSLLDEVPHIGPKRKKALLHHFGSVKAIQDAIADDLAKVDGISRDLAKKIYEYFHSG